MMKQWTLFPTVLQRKFLLTLLAGIASAGISVIICVATKDHILLALGIVVLCACLISCRGIWATAAHKNYEVVEGICAGISTPMLRRYRKVHLIDSHGIEITLLLSKSALLKIGEPYRFYFQKGSRPVVGNDYLDAALSTNSFLGYEAISEPEKAELKDMTDIPLMFFEGTEIYLYCNHFTKRIQLLDKVMYNVLYVN